MTGVGSRRVSAMRSVSAFAVLAIAVLGSAVAHAQSGANESQSVGAPVINARNCAALVSILGCGHELSAAQAVEFAPGTQVRHVCVLECKAHGRVLQEGHGDSGADAEHSEHGEDGEDGEHGEHGEHGEEGEHDEHGEEGTIADVMAATLVGLIMITIGFEMMHDALDEAAGERMQEVVDAMFAELTVLGFIGLLTFISIQTEAAHWLGEHLFPHEPEEFVEILEHLHMLLFFVMVVFISEVVFLILSGRSNIANWQRCEAAISDHDNYHMHSKEFYSQGDKAQHTHVGMHLFYQSKGEVQARRVVEFDWLKARFLQQANKQQHRMELGSSFDLAAYFTSHQQHIFEHLIDIENSTWIMVTCLVPILRLAMYMPAELMPRAFVGFGWFIFLCSVVIRLDMRKIMVLLSPRPHCAPELSTDVSVAPRGDLSTSLVGQHGGTGIGDAAPSSFVQHRPICTHEDLHKSSSIKELVPQYKTLRHTRGHLKGQRKKHDHLFYHPAHRFACCGALHKHVAAHQIALQLISLLMLVTAAYISVFVKQIGSWLKEIEDGHGGGSGVVFVVLALLPIVLVAIQFPHVCVDYVMASGIEDLISEEELHRTVVNQRAASVVKLLKMLALARKQKLMLGKLLDGQDDEATGGTPSEIELPEHFKDEIEDLWHQYDRDGSGSVDAAEFKAIVSEVSDAHWSDAELAKMFSVVDTDSSGEISKKEFQGFMAAHLQPANPEEDAKMLFELIDFDHGGEVSATEFRAFLCGFWTGHLPDQPEATFEFPPAILDDREVERLVAQNNSGPVHAKVQHIFLSGTVKLEPGADVVITDRPPPRADMSDDEIEEIVQLADKGGDGVINVEEFCRFVKQYTKT